MVTSSAAMVRIRDAVARDSFVVTRVLTDACVVTPLGRGLDHDPSTRRDLTQVYIGGLVAATMLEGIVRVAQIDGEIVGAALWSMHQPVDGPLLAAPAADGNDDGTAQSVVQSWRQRVQRLVDDRCPPGVAYHRLLHLGVRPDRHGEGIGSYLLIGHHSMLDIMGVPALLVADDTSRPFFERHSYSGIGPAQLLPGRVPMSVMWREPAPADPP